jgi:tellurite resistance protein TerC
VRKKGCCVSTPALTTLLLFGVTVVFFLWLDLYRHRADAPMRLGSALAWSLAWLGLALGFSGYIGLQFGRDKAWLFLAGYLLEQSLSVDNLFVFMAIFASFGVRDAYQHRILYYGILGAIVLRLAFILLGTGMLVAGETNHVLHAVVFSLFGIAVLWSAYIMYRALGGEGAEIEDFTHHWSVRWTRRLVRVSPHLEGNRFFVRRDRRWSVTPLFLCLVAVEASDVVFAVDSVPAVIAVTREPFLIYTSNIFAILGLRSMYFLLSAARKYLCHLEKAIIGILVFIGTKLLIEAFHEPLAALVGHSVELSAGASLIVVLATLAAGVLASFVFPERDLGQQD